MSLRRRLALVIAPGLREDLRILARIAVPALQDDKQTAVDALLLIESCGAGEQVRIASNALDTLEIDRSRPRELA
jgi:hypothetical protein